MTPINLEGSLSSIDYYKGGHITEYDVTTSAPSNETLPVIPELWQLAAAYNLFLYVSPVIILFGTSGNLLSMVVVIQSSLFKNTPFSFLLCALAVADTGVLTTGLLRHWLRVLTEGMDIRSFNNPGCKIHVFLSYLFPQLSSWTLMLMTIWRAISVVFPLKIKTLSRSLWIVLLWILLTGIITALNAHLLFTFNLRKFHAEDSEGVVQEIILCYVDEEAEDFFSKVWVWIDLLMVVVIPLIVITICNAVIIHRMCNPKVQRLRSGSVRKLNAQARSTTVMLLVLSTVFFLTTTPWGIYFVGLPHWPYDTLSDVMNLELVYTVCNLLYTLNSAINFLLYSVSASKFRIALVQIICCRKPNPRRGSSSHGTTPHVQSTHPWSSNRLSVISAQSLNSNHGSSPPGSTRSTSSTAGLMDSSISTSCQCQCGRLQNNTCECTRF